MRLSVAMTVCDGLPFLSAQLESILDQTVLAYEIVIGDDASTDGSSEVLDVFAARKEAPVRVIRQAQRRGLRMNLQTVLSEVRGDVIVLADQDDIWRSDKLEAIQTAFARTSTTLWFCNAMLIDSSDRPLNRTTWEAVHIDETVRRLLESPRAMDRLLHGQIVTGATMAVSAQVLSLALPLPMELELSNHPFLHDGWLAVIAATQGKIVADPRPLMGYRQHSGQYTQMSMSMSGRDESANRRPARARLRQLVVEKQRLDLVLNRLRERKQIASTKASVSKELERRSRFLEVRLHGGLPSMIAAFIRGDYRRYARSRTLALDIARIL